MRVTRSSDDVLFLIGGSNDVLSLFTETGFHAAVKVAEWRDRLAARNAFFQTLGIPWCQLLSPEKLSVLGGPTLRSLGADAIGPGARLCSALPSPFLLDPSPYFRAQHAQGYSVFPRTDSHWTPLGAFCAFQWAASALGLAIDDAPFHATQIRSLTYYGDLWTSGHADIPPDRFDRRALPASVTRSHANAIVLLKEREHRENEAGLHIGSHVIYRNSNAPLNERLMLFGSSFSDCRAECSLLTFTTALFFREVHFVWSTNLDVALIKRTAPDRMLIEMPERFLTTCPDDSFSLASYETQTLNRHQHNSAL